MADQAPVAGLVLFIDDDTARFQQGMRRSQQIVEESTRRMERGLQGVDKAQRGLNNTMGRFDASAFRNTAREILFAENGVKRLQSSFVLLAGTVAGFSTAQMTMQLGKVADQYTTIRNRIATVVSGQKEQAAAEQAIFDVAQRTRTSFEAGATMYARLANSVPELAGDQAKLMRVIETVQKSFVVAGSTTQEAQSAAVQLAQGLASGRLQGDELKSILENNIPLARTLADALAGGNVGRLREMGSEGLLNAENVIGAILKGTSKIDEQFARTMPRIADGWQAIDNAFTRYIGQLDKSLGASEKMAKGLMHIAANFDEIGRAAGYAAAAIAAVMIARRAGSLVVAPVVGAAQDARRSIAMRAQETLEARAAAEMRRDFAEREAQKARDEAAKVGATNTFNRAPKADQAAFGRAAARVDAARAAADRASAAEIANIEKRIAMEGQSVAATAAVTRAQERLNDALKKRASLMVQAQGGETSRRAQSETYKAMFDEIAARERLMKAQAAAQGGISPVAGQFNAENAAVAKAQAQLDASLKKRAQMLAQAQSQTDGGVSRQSQNRAFRALFDEAAAREQLAKADAHLKMLEDRNRKIQSTISRLESGTPAQQRAAPMFRNQEAENAAARVAAEKEVANAQKGVETAMRNSERAAAALDKERLARTREAGKALVDAERDVNAARDQLSKAQMARESAASKATLSARQAADKEVIAATKAVDDATKRAEAARASMSAERVSAARGAGRELLDAEKQVAAAREQLGKSQLDQESARLKQQAALDQQGLALRRARVAAEKQLATAQQALAGASMAVGVGAQGALNSAAKAVADADARVAAIKREEAALATAATNAASRTSILGQAAAATSTVAMGAFRGLTAFLGGPWGVALTAGSAALGYFMYSQSQAAAAAERHKAALESLKGAMETLSKTPGIDPDALLKLKSELPAVIEGVKAQLNTLANTMPSGLTGMFDTIGREISTRLHEAGVATYGFQQKLRELKPGSKETEDALKTLIEELYRLSATAPPNFGPHIAEMMKAANAAYTLTRAAREANAAVANAATAGGAAPKTMSARELREGTVGWTPQDYAVAKNFQTSYNQAQKELVDTNDKLAKKRAEELHNTNLIVAGKEREADIISKTREIIESRGSLYKPEDYEGAVREATALVDAEKRLKDFRESESKSKRSGASEAKKELNFVERIARLREQGKASFFSDLDRSVIDELKNMKASPELMASTNAALAAGQQLTGKAKEIRDALMMKDAGSTYRQLIPQYGTMKQALAEAAEYQEKLNMLVNLGKISADQAAIAYADYLTKFESFKWIEDGSQAFGKFLETSLMDMKSVGDAFQTLLKDIQRMLIQEFVVGPIRKLVKTAITDMFTPAGGAGGILNQIMGGLGIGGAAAGGGAMSGGINTIGVGGLYHTGGIAGAPGSATRVMPASTWDHAPRYHSGKLGPKEIPAILERGETVRTEGQERRLSNTFGALAEAAAAPRGGNTSVEVHPPPNTRTEQRRRRSADGGEHIVLMIKQVIMDDVNANGEIAQSLQGRYGMNRVAGKG